MPSQAEIEQHQQDVQELSVVAAAAVAAAVMAADEGDADSLLTQVPAILARYMSAAADLAVDWYRSLARENPVPVPERSALAPIMGPADRISLLNAADFDPEPAELPPREQLEATIRWAVYQPTRAPALPDATEPSAELPAGEEAAPSAATDRRAAAIDRAAAADQSLDTAADQPLDTTAGQSPQDIGGPAPDLRARVLSADETDLRARVIPPDASDQQARIISRLVGATQRYVTTAARDTITANAEREQVRWVREAKPDACSFCRLLATKGTTGSDPGYLTAESAKRVVGRRGRERGRRKIGELYHDYCRCEPVAIRAGDSYTPPAHVADWDVQYRKAVAEVGNAGDTKAILAAMRAAEKSAGGSSH